MLTLDPPYGGDVEHWDKEPESEENIDAVLKGFKLCTAAAFHTVAIYVPLAMVAMVRKVLEANSYAYIQELVWFKPNHNLSGAAFSLIPSVGEVILIAYSSAEAKVLDRSWIRFNRNPLERPNLIVAPTCPKRKRDLKGRVINSHEKPSCIMSYLVPMLCVPGAKVVVAGGGALGDGLGIVAAGFDCFTFEKDPKQFMQMIGFLSNHELVNESKLVIPFGDVNRRLSLDKFDVDAQQETLWCDRCQNVIKNDKDGCLCNTCMDKNICEECAGGFGSEAPSCKKCEPVRAASISGPPA